VPTPFFTEVDATVPDAVAANREGAALKAVDLLDKRIEGYNLAGGLPPPAVIPDLEKATVVITG
jgi:hypothetical protein